MKSGIKIWMVLVGMFCTTLIQAQVEEEEEEDEYVTKPKIEREAENRGTTGNQNTEADRKFFFGGDFGLSFGDFTFINLSPRVGYRINDKTIAGVGIRYNYLRWRFRDFSNQIIPELTIEENWMGGGLFFQRIFDIPNLNIGFQPFVGFEPEILHIRRSSPTEYSYTAPFILAGGGIMQRFGNSGMVFLGGYYNLTHSSHPLTASPFIFRMGFGF